MKIACFYHVYQTGNWGSLVNEQLNLLKSSGLCDASAMVYVGVNGDEEFPFYDEKLTIVRNLSPELEEAPTLESLRKFCEFNSGWNVLYFHTKGVTKQTPETTDWRKIMEYYCIERWEDCLKNLQVHDTVGCLYMDECYLGFYPHYSGNFWWAKSDYIRTLNHGYLKNGIRNNREFWIGTGNGSMFSFLNTGLNHYAVRFPREAYADLVNNE